LLHSPLKDEEVTGLGIFGEFIKVVKIGGGLVLTRLVGEYGD
jgi:hypothetical protein